MARRGGQDAHVGTMWGLAMALSRGFAIYAQLNRGTLDQARQAGQVSGTDVAQWWGALEQAAQAGAFFAASLGFITVGSKPGRPRA
jgi:hypothetical protein